MIACRAFIAVCVMCTILDSAVAMAGQSAQQQPVKGSSSSARAAAQAVIVGPPAMDCDRIVRTMTVRTDAVGATTPHRHDVLVIACGTEAGRMVVSVVPLRAGNGGGSAESGIDVMSAAGTGMADTPRLSGDDHVHVIQFQRNFE